MMPKRKLTAIDLFAGCGGLTLGLKQAGFKVLGAVEIDPLAIETYKLNHRDVRVWHADIKKLPASYVMRALGLKPGELDVLAGCPPCQGFSRITSLNGHYRARDPRNDLVYEFCRFVRVLRPKAVMLENVPGLARNYRARALKKALTQLGYEVNADVLDAADYGVPQRRRRYILLAAERRPPFARSARSRRTVRQAFKAIGPRARKDALHTLPEHRTQGVRDLIRLVPKNGGSRSALGKRRQLECHSRSDGFKDVYGRMAWDHVAPTITGGCCNPSKGRFLHPTKNRCISLREAAVLQSFPAGYKFSLRQGKFAVAEMIGNALPPEFIRRHASSLAHLLRGANDEQVRR